MDIDDVKLVKEAFLVIATVLGAIVTVYGFVKLVQMRRVSTEE